MSTTPPRLPVAPRLRPATPDDVPALSELERSSFGADAWSAASITHELASSDRVCLVAQDASGIVGYAVTRTVGDVADLQRVAVIAPSQGQGVATALLEDLIDQAAAQGASRVLLEVSAANAAATGCYQRLDFAEVDRRRGYYRDGSDAVVMQRWLDGAPDRGDR